MSTFDDGAPATGQFWQVGPNIRTQIAWGGVGFLLGVIVWHFVGFWTFVSTIVFRGPDPATNVSGLSTTLPAAAVPATNVRDRTASNAAKRSETVLGTAPARDAAWRASSECTALLLDRTAGTTSLATCAIAEPPFRVVENTQRGDRITSSAVRVTGWSVVVDAGGDVSAIEASGGKIDAPLDPRSAEQSVRLD